MMFPYGETITWLQPGKMDDPYSGESLPDWNNPVATEIPGCVLFPANASGNTENSDVGRPEQVVQTLTVLLPPGVELEPPDKVVARGHTFDVIGFTDQFVNPYSGWAPGGQVTIRRQYG